MLFCVDGRGRVQYEENFHELKPGECYMIESMVSHAVFADEDSQLTLISVADDHRAVNSTERLEMVSLDE